MKRVFCTIITTSHLSYAKTLFHSINKFDGEVDFVVLIVDYRASSLEFKFQILTLDQLVDRDFVTRLQERYLNDNDAFRWSLKPVLMIHLFQQGNYDQVFFVDPDLYFFSSLSFLYHELSNNSFLLSPHWKPMSPEIDENGFLSNFSDGIFNAGFLGATSKGLDTLKWWAKMCLYSSSRIVVDKPIYADQSYLDLFVVRNPDSKVLFHKGCNVAIWNQEECKRIVDNSGEVLINGEFPIVFIHFSHPIDLYKQDKILYPYLLKYSNALIENGHPTGIIKLAKNYFYRQALKRLTILQRIKRKYFGVKYFDESDF